MGLFNLGFITTYMSDPMIGGFTTGAAVHVGTSQVKYLFGLKIPRSDGVFQIVRVSLSDFNHKINCKCFFISANYIDNAFNTFYVGHERCWSCTIEL